MSVEPEGRESGPWGAPIGERDAPADEQSAEEKTFDKNSCCLADVGERAYVQRTGPPRPIIFASKFRAAFRSAQVHPRGPAEPDPS